MKATSFDGSDLRLVVAGATHDAAVCAGLAAVWGGENSLGSPAPDLLVGLAVGFWRQYGEPPDGKLAAALVRHAAQNLIPDDVLQGAERLLRQIEEEHRPDEAPAPKFVLETAEGLLNQHKAKRLMEAAEDELLRGDAAGAFARLGAAAPVRLQPSTGKHLAVDYEPWLAAFDEERMKPLVEYPGKMGRFFGDVLQRGTFISFMGPVKSGKSFWINDLVVRALRQQRRVAYFEVGDLGEEECILRLGQRVLRRPLQAGIERIPTSWVKDGENWTLEYEEKRFEEDLKPGEAFKALRKLCRGDDLLVMDNYAAGVLNVAGMAATLDNWANAGWRADVVAVDYADILAPPVGRYDVNEQIDKTWEQLRRLSLEQNCLVVTATQSSALAYGMADGVLSSKHFSGRKTKLAHVNGMIGINVTAKEKEQGITRLNWPVRRKGRNSPRRVVRVAGCLGLACPALLVEP